MITVNCEIGILPREGRFRHHSKVNIQGVKVTGVDGLRNGTHEIRRAISSMLHSDHCHVVVERMEVTKSVGTRRAPAQWCSIAGFRVLDPDGWRQDGTPFEKPVTWKEFVRRVYPSTVDNPTAVMKLDPEKMPLYNLTADIPPEQRQKVKGAEVEALKKAGQVRRTADNTCYARPVTVQEVRLKNRRIVLKEMPAELWCNRKYSLRIDAAVRDVMGRRTVQTQHIAMYHETALALMYLLMTTFGSVPMRSVYRYRKSQQIPLRVRDRALRRVIARKMKETD